MPLSNVIQDATETIKGIAAIATNAEILAGTDDAKNVTSLKAKQLNEAKNIGLVQTLQNVTVSRALGTVYTNSSGRPIFVIVKTTFGAGNNVFTIDVGAVSFTNGGNGSYESFSKICFLVPTGATYKVALTTGSGALQEWMELR